MEKTSQVVKVSDGNGVRVGVRFNNNPNDIDFPIRQMNGSVVYKDRSRLNAHTRQRVIAVMDTLHQQGQAALNDHKVQSLIVSWRIGAVQQSAPVDDIKALIKQVQQADDSARAQSSFSDYDNISIQVGDLIFVKYLSPSRKN